MRSCAFPKLLTVLAVASNALAPLAETVAQTTTSLPMGEIEKGYVSPDESISYEFNAGGAGILTVAVRGQTPSADLVLELVDSFGQQLPNGFSDKDILGMLSAEQVAAVVPYEGTYHAEVSFSFEGRSDEAEFLIGASWLRFDQVENLDSDRLPSQGRLLELGDEVDSSLDLIGGDHWDWYRVEVQSTGLLVVSTRASVGDLVLEGYLETDLRNWVQRSDQDLEGVVGNESLLMNVSASDVVYIKVSTFSQYDESIASYTLFVDFIDR